VTVKKKEARWECGDKTPGKIDLDTGELGGGEPQGGGGGVGGGGGGWCVGLTGDKKLGKDKGGSYGDAQVTRKTRATATRKAG